MGDYGTTKIIGKLYQCVKGCLEIVDNKDEQEKKNGEKKRKENLVRFRKLLNEFLSDNHIAQENESSGTQHDEEGGNKGLQGLRGDLRVTITSAQIREKKISNLGIFKIFTDATDLTLMQFIADKGLPDFLEILLNAGIDPNYPAKLDEHDNKVALPPVLLAAHNGDSQILKMFKKHNYDIKAATNLIVVDESSDPNLRSSCCSDEKTTTELQSIRLKSMDMNDANREEAIKQPCNFAVWSSKGETVLHLLLKEPRASDWKESSKNTLPRTAKAGQTAYINFKEKRAERRRAIRKQYLECLNVILSTETLSQFHEEQLK